MTTSANALPVLTDWETHPTRTSLHHSAKLLSELRRAYGSPQPMALHLALYVTPQGVTTGKTSADEFILNIAEAAIEYHMPSGDKHTFHLHQYTDTSNLRGAVLQAVGKFQPTDGVRATETLPIQINPVLAHEYHFAFQTIAVALARTRGWLRGTLSPLVVWAHGFDLATIWFKGHKLDEHQPHIAVGFSPGSPGFARPYVYAYAYPMPSDFEGLPLPKLAYWTSTTWKGAVIGYDALVAGQAAAKNTEIVLQSTLLAIFETLASQLV